MKTISECSRACLLFVIIISSLLLMNAVSIVMLIRLNRKNEKLAATEGYEPGGYELSR